MKIKRSRQIISNLSLKKTEFSSLSIREKFQGTTEGGSKLEGCQWDALGDSWFWQALELSVCMPGMGAALSSVKPNSESRGG